MTFPITVTNSFLPPSSSVVQERFTVITSNGVATVNFANTYTNPHVALAVQSIDTGDARAITAEFFNLTPTSVSVKTVRQGATQLVLGVSLVGISSLVDTRVDITVSERV